MGFDFTYALSREGYRVTEINSDGEIEEVRIDDAYRLPFLHKGRYRFQRVDLLVSSEACIQTDSHWEARHTNASLR